MELIKIISDKERLCIDCPECDNWEQLTIDEPRHKLQIFSIEEWYPDIEGKNEISRMKCSLCENEFNLEWDYSNISDD